MIANGLMKIGENYLYRNWVVIGLGIICVILSAYLLRLWNANRALRKEINELGRELDDAVKRLAEFEGQQKSKAFIKIVDLLAAAGVPGLILLCAMAVSGFTGAAAITVALSSIGGPAGMLGGVGVLVTVGIVIAKYGISEVCIAVVKKILQSKSRDQIIREIDALPRSIPQKFRLKAKAMLHQEGR